MRSINQTDTRGGCGDFQLSIILRLASRVAKAKTFAWVLPRTCGVGETPNMATRGYGYGSKVIPKERILKMEVRESSSLRHDANIWVKWHCLIPHLMSSVSGDIFDSLVWTPQMHFLNNFKLNQAQTGTWWRITYSVNGSLSVSSSNYTPSSCAQAATLLEHSSVFNDRRPQ